jgi:uncharacterized protein YciI
VTRRLFAVSRARGPAWDAAKPMEQQADWAGHAAFISALHRDGFVRLVGPLEGTNEALLIVEAESAVEIGARLADDCWSQLGLLVTARIAPWQLRLGVIG